MKTKKTGQKKVVKVMVTLKNRSHPYPRVGLDVEMMMQHGCQKVVKVSYLYLID